MDKWTIINQIQKLAKEERRNADRYIELNQNDAERRRALEAATLAAYQRVLATLTE